MSAINKKQKPVEKAKIQKNDSSVYQNDEFIQTQLTQLITIVQSTHH